MPDWYNILLINIELTPKIVQFSDDPSPTL